jgi:hypothetical protein
MVASAGSTCLAALQTFTLSIAIPPDVLGYFIGLKMASLSLILSFSSSFTLRF